MVLKRPYNIPLINLRLLSTEQRGCERRDKDRSGLIIPEVPTTTNYFLSALSLPHCVNYKLYYRFLYISLVWYFHRDLFLAIKLTSIYNCMFIIMIIPIWCIDFALLTSDVHTVLQ